VAEQVVLGQRLFDQQEVEGIQPRQVPCVGTRVRGVRVDLEQDVVEPLAYGAYGLQVQARLDLQLDAGVPL
jgi:hypothetical protein